MEPLNVLMVSESSCVYRWQLLNIFRSVQESIPLALSGVECLGRIRRLALLVREKQVDVDSRDSRGRDTV